MKLFRFLAFIALCCLISCSAEQQCETAVRKRCTDEEFMGIIKEVYFDGGSHGTPTIVLNNNHKYYSSTFRLICFAGPGDSIIKKKGTLAYLIKRPDTTVTFYPNCGNLILLDSGKTTNEHYEFDDCGKQK